MSFKTGVIHGRFQVPHLDHVKYLLAGKAKCDHLVIGITNPEPPAHLTPESSAVDGNRDLPLSNPLTYYERYLLIQTVMRDYGIAWEDFAIVPLPIHSPHLYGNYVPLEAVFFLTIYDDWGRQKLNYFSALGLLTLVLWERPPEQKGICSNDVRRRMIKGDAWEQMVPQSVASYLKEWRIPERLIQIEKKGSY